MRRSLGLLAFFFFVGVSAGFGAPGVRAVGALKPTSEFTSTKPSQSKVLMRGQESVLLLCKGLGGYQVKLLHHWERSHLNLEYRGVQVDLGVGSAPGEFHDKSNDVVQWRGYRKPGGFEPYAMIYRLSSWMADSPKRRFNTLLVIKLDGVNSCVVGHVDGSRSNGNTLAEEMADRLCGAR